MKNKIKILMAAVEAVPLVKVGGLADVVGALSAALNLLDCEARVIIPKYPFIDETKWGLEKVGARFNVCFGGRDCSVELWRTDKAIKGTVVYLLENKEYFGGAEVYSPDFSRHEGETFIFFDLAVLESLPHLEFKPEIIHCHDFHCGLIPALIKNKRYRQLGNIKTLFTIHNFEYQGRNLPEVISAANIEIDSLPSLIRDAQDGDVNFMVQGIINADLVNTVSRSYAKEITKPEFASGLVKITRAYRRKIKGVLNGIDVSYFNPSSDPDIKKNYSVVDFSGKEDNKDFLQKKMGLERKGSVPLIAFVSRLYDQKGLSLLGDWLFDLEAQFVFLGEGDANHEVMLSDLAARYPKSIAGFIGFDEVLARQIYAGADIFLMPSLFEPCGLGQMISARYGTIPVVRHVGGLKDTVDGNIGFYFRDFSQKSLQICLKKVIKVYKFNHKKWLKLKKNCLKKDFSWKKSALKYLDLYRKISSKI